MPKEGTRYQMQYYCCDCYVIHHESQALHNRATRIHGLHVPLLPTVVEKNDAERHIHITLVILYI